MQVDCQKYDEITLQKIDRKHVTCVYPIEYRTSLSQFYQLDFGWDERSGAISNTCWILKFTIPVGEGIGRVLVLDKASSTFLC